MDNYMKLAEEEEEEEEEDFTFGEWEELSYDASS
jgi:hypothetical protein